MLGCKKQAKYINDPPTVRIKLRSVLMSSMHTHTGKLGNWVEIMRVGVYYARDARAFRAVIKCLHCTCDLTPGARHSNHYKPLRMVNKDTYMDIHSTAGLQSMGWSYCRKMCGLVKDCL